MKRVVINVATDSWVQGQQRLISRMQEQHEHTLTWTNKLPRNCPPHRTKGITAGAREHDCRPYAFKAYALKEAQDQHFETLLWCDASIVPVKSLEPLWAKIERDGYWFCRNGWSNYEWTADSAYPDLFPELAGLPMEHPRAANKAIPHVVATAFGLSMWNEKAHDFLAEYYRLASQTRAFCGPWQNENAPRERGRNNQRPAAPCGPPDVLGHRHDQTAASVLAFRFGMELTNPPEYFAYRVPGEELDPRAILVAEGTI